MQRPGVPRESKRKARRGRIRVINRSVLMICAVFLPVYLALRLTGGSAEKLELLPDLLSRIKTPIVWEVPGDGVRYLHFYHGEPNGGNKFVLVRFHMEARMKIGYAIVPRCFNLVDSDDTRHFPLSRSPVFLERGIEFRLDRDDAFTGELLFEIPSERDADRLLFKRYQE